MARDPGRLGCAVESRERGEPMVGTASRVRRWLVIEQPGPWGRDALRESYVDPFVAARVALNAKQHGVRVLLGRRVGADRSAPKSVFLARTDRVHRWIERVELDDVAQVAELDLAALGADEPPGLGQPGPSNLALVCTNGRHDPCCADFGRPVVRALRDAGMEPWECSHVGGDRFAANVVCLPTGVYLGRVPPEAAARILDDLADGVLDLDCYRGRSAYPPLLQAAEIFARRELAERRLTSLRFADARGTSSEAVVHLAHDDGRTVEVHVVRERAPAAMLTCADLDETGPWQQRLVALIVHEP